MASEVLLGFLPYTRSGSPPEEGGARGELWRAVRRAAAASPGGRLGPADFAMVGAIAAGPSTRVDRVELRGSPGARFAMKTVDLAGAAPTPEDSTPPGEVSHVKVRRLLVEVEVMQRCVGHPAVCCLFDVFPGERPLTHCLVLELCEGGDLAAALRAAGGRLPEAAAREHARQVLEGLGHLHDRGVLLRDLKPENIGLGGGGGRAVLIDFDLACIPGWSPGGGGGGERGEGGGAGDMPGVMHGTLDYLAPEVIKAGTSAAHTRASDLWQVGVLLYEMLYGIAPFTAFSPEKTMYNITMRGVSFPRPSEGGAVPEVSGAAKSAVRSLLRQNVAVRAGFHGGVQEVLAHEFFTS